MNILSYFFEKVYFAVCILAFFILIWYNIFVKYPKKENQYDR